MIMGLRGVETAWASASSRCGSEHLLVYSRALWAEMSHLASPSVRFFTHHMGNADGSLTGLLEDVHDVCAHLVHHRHSEMVFLVHFLGDIKAHRKQLSGLDGQLHLVAMNEGHKMPVYYGRVVLEIKPPPPPCFVLGSGKGPSGRRGLIISFNVMW